MCEQEDDAPGSGGGAIPVATGAATPVPGSRFVSAESSLDTSPVMFPQARGPSKEYEDRRLLSHEVCYDGSLISFFCVC